MTTTKKHREFVGEPMGNKPVTVLPGIGPVLGERLKNAGFSRADNLYGQYLVHNQNKAAFNGWMNQTVAANNKQASDCHTALKTWSEHHF